MNHHDIRERGSIVACSAIAVRHKHTASVTCRERRRAVLTCSRLIPGYLNCSIQACGHPFSTELRCTTNRMRSRGHVLRSCGRDRSRRRSKGRAGLATRCQATTAASSTRTLASSTVRQRDASHDLSEYHECTACARGTRGVHVSICAALKMSGPAAHRGYGG